MSDKVSIYLERIADFARFLRDRGISAGIAETKDAVSILSETDLSDRSRVKDILRIVFAKSRAEQEIFDRCFDLYFVTAEQKKAIEEAERKAREEYEKAMQQSEADLSYNGQPMDLDDTQREVYARMPEEVRERLRSIKDRFKDDIDRQPELYASFIKSIFMKSIMEQQLAMDDAAAQSEGFDDPELELLFRNISDFKESEIPKAASLIELLSRQLNGELQAKAQKAGKSGKLDFKKTIRKGLSTGGTFFRLKYKRKHKKRRRLILLLDVSGSMIQFSAFAMEFIQSLSTISENSRTFVFSEDLTEIDRTALLGIDSFRTYVKSTGLYGKGTNLAAALGRLMAIRPSVLSGSSMLVILSDTKTVNVSETEKLLSAASSLAGSILWLNPIPERKWAFVKSITRLSGICRMVPCSTLAELSKACKRIM